MSPTTSRRPATGCLRRWRAVLGRPSAAGRDQGSLVLAMLVVLVASSVAALLVPVLVGQVNSTTFDSRRVRQLAAAQSGIDVALARIRSASALSNDGLQLSGLVAKLPCDPLTGAVASATGLRYRTTIAYYGVDPASNPLAPVLRCITTFGTGTVVPAYAVITSKGTDVGTGNITTLPGRTVTATYVFQTTNANLPGGLMRVYRTLATDSSLCLDAGAAPAVNTVLTVQSCDITNASQRWSYNPNLTISLNSSVTAGSLGLCVDGASSPEVRGAVLRLQACATTTVRRQQWGWNGWASFMAQDAPAGTDTNTDFCWNLSRGANAGSGLVLGGACGQYARPVSWQPDSTVGSGAAGTSTGQLVNFGEFSRCLDDTNNDVNQPYMISWPCKQNIDPSRIDPNQRWTVTTSGSLEITMSGTRYCLTRPADPTAGYPTLVPCLSTLLATQTWRYSGWTGAWATSYRVSDLGTTLCLQPNSDTTPPDYMSNSGNIAKIVVRPCSATNLQKWNAPPVKAVPSVKDQHES